MGANKKTGFLGSTSKSNVSIESNKFSCPFDRFTSRYAHTSSHSYNGFNMEEGGNGSENAAICLPFNWGNGMYVFFRIQLFPYIGNTQLVSWLPSSFTYCIVRIKLNVTNL